MAAVHDLLSESPTEVSVYEVGLRDGLQNEPQVIATEQKVELARALVASGLSRIEATSFVSPKWVPQLADASDGGLHGDSERGGVWVLLEAVGQSLCEGG
jgi:hydroxymethylglutaryl-CoA lyase